MAIFTLILAAALALVLGALDAQVLTSTREMTLVRAAFLVALHGMPSLGLALLWLEAKRLRAERAEVSARLMAALERRFHQA